MHTHTHTHTHTNTHTYTHTYTHTHTYIDIDKDMLLIEQTLLDQCLNFTLNFLYKIQPHALTTCVATKKVMNQRN